MATIILVNYLVRNYRETQIKAKSATHSDRNRCVPQSVGRFTRSSVFPKTELSKELFN